jgi:outer membrane protein assembly factor BamB
VSYASLVFAAAIVATPTGVALSSCASPPDDRVTSNDQPVMTAPPPSVDPTLTAVSIDPRVMTVPLPALDPPLQVLTQHNDVQRTGANLRETILTPRNVHPDTFGLLFKIPVDGDVYAQPLYLGATQVQKDGVPVTANVLYVATTTNWVYAFDADTGALYWANHVADTGEEGIYSTPVIDPETGTLYVVARVTDGNGPREQACPLERAKAQPPYLRRKFVLFRISTVTGATVKRADIGNPDGRGAETFCTVRQKPALLLAHRRILVGFGSRREDGNVDARLPDGGVNPNPDTTWLYHGWVVAFDAETLQRRDAVNMTPHSFGGGVWQAGNGLAMDPDGHAVFLQTGNSAQNFDCERDASDTPNDGDMQSSFVRIPVSDAGSFGQPAIHRASNAHNALMEFTNIEHCDQDLGAAGTLILPGGKLLGGGKTGIFYVLDQEPEAGKLKMRQEFQAFWNSWEGPNDLHYASETNKGGRAWSKVASKGPHIHGSPVLWSRTGDKASFVYAWSELDYLKQFEYAGGTLKESATAKGTGASGIDLYLTQRNGAPEGKMAGGILSLSANGDADGSGIVWAVHNDGNTSAGRATGHLYAFNAETLGKPLFEDIVPTYARHTAPTVVNGKVYVATHGNSVRVYGLRTYAQDSTFLTSPASTKPFCPAGMPLLPAELDGNGRADLVCFDRTGEGRVAIAMNVDLTRAIEPSFTRDGWCPTDGDVVTGDFDGNGRTDLLCRAPHAPLPRLKIAYAGTDGRFNFEASPYTIADWCNGAADQLVAADFNGDGRADLLCHNRSNGDLRFKYANQDGARRFDGAGPNFENQKNGSYPDWTPTFHWCFDSASAIDAAPVVKAGDFNGDGRKDLLCYDPAHGPSGVLYAKPMNSSAVVPGIGGGDFEQALGWEPMVIPPNVNHSMWWCGGGQTFAVADFNGDGTDDILCHDKVGGADFIDFARGPVDSTESPGTPLVRFDTPTFPAPWGTSSVRGARRWCTGRSTLVVADLDGDRRTDLVCYDPGDEAKDGGAPDGGAQAHATAALAPIERTPDERHDSFCDPALDPSRWSVSDPAKRLTPNGSCGLDYASHKTATATRLDYRRKVRGDFDVSAEIDFTAHESPTSAAQYVALELNFGPNELVTVERGAAKAPANVDSYQFWSVKNGQGTPFGHVDVPAAFRTKPTILRLARTSSIIRAWVFTDRWYEVLDPGVQPPANDALATPALRIAPNATGRLDLTIKDFTIRQGELTPF